MSTTEQQRRTRVLLFFSILLTTQHRACADPSSNASPTKQLAFLNCNNGRNIIHNRRLLFGSPPPASASSADNNNSNSIKNNSVIKRPGFGRIRQIFTQHEGSATSTKTEGTPSEGRKKDKVPTPEGLGTVTFFDYERDECGDYCMLVDSKDPSLKYAPNFFTTSLSEGLGWNLLDQQQTATQVIDKTINILPVIAPFIAFWTYDDVAMIFNVVIEGLANKKWVAVDGGAYQAKIIAPAINGVVVPAISILFATLISNTVATLRQRQLDIRTSLNLEASELRCLQAMVDSFHLGPEQDKCRSYLVQYTSRLIAESQPNVELNSLEFTGSVDSEMNGFLSQLNAMSMANANPAPRQPSSSSSSSKGSKRKDKEPQQQQQYEQQQKIPVSILSETYGAVHRLNGERSTRISALQSTFPVLHYSILSVLAVSICTAFLMETNQELLIFLNAIQLKLLWTMLISTFTALAVVCYDLSDPFRGSYQITRSVDQLYTIRSAICAADKSSKEARHDSDDEE
mmetsp:Transcript_31764/g.48720  ORF Transcript_31764/g.48720 Transcript_31764/m.48720 type:complete len:514 (-) Transcript_31764:287-1828(-)|eukprot:CAMPEP_0195307946 /NCGR_PEP_ID=MMETSP0707-20130614/37973_1 /TAXON_ID=33640 /ORGANISM="Asterionellopsis glacialis, Strain CCMP134" /LENGTH=513 /DNA_ID=CAMNT_0040372201 /DNA_START=185 /DNA_END=1726 /DNA_ORIENTATION=+